MLQKKYQPQLRDGIKIAVDLVNSVKQDKVDGDVDVRVKIAPNDENDLTEVLYRGNKVILEKPFEKMEELEGSKVSIGDTVIHVLTNHGQDVNLEDRLRNEVIDIAIKVREAKYTSTAVAKGVFDTKITNYDAKIANLQKDVEEFEALDVLNQKQQQKYDKAKKFLAKQMSSRQNTYDQRVGILANMNKLETDYADLGNNYEQVRLFLDDSTFNDKGGKARKALLKLDVSKFNSNDEFKILMSKAIKNNDEEIDNNFSAANIPIGTKHDIEAPLDTTAKTFVETLTLGTGTDFIQSSKPFTKLKMFLVKSKVTPQPMFVIETAYPN